MGTPQFGIEMEPRSASSGHVTARGEGPLTGAFNGCRPAAMKSRGTPVNMCPNLDYGCPEFEDFFRLYGGRVNEAIRAGKLPADTQALTVIEDWQQDLKKVTLRIVWPEEGQTKSYERVNYMHAEDGGE
jgi:hypothetical protein